VLPVAVDAGEEALEGRTVEGILVEDLEVVGVETVGVVVVGVTAVFTEDTGVPEEPAGVLPRLEEVRQLESVPGWTVKGAVVTRAPVLSRRVSTRLVPLATGTAGQENELPV